MLHATSYNLTNHTTEESEHSSMDFPTISIVIPTFNAALTLERAIQSLLIQNYPHLELILMDGASQDETMAIAQQYTAHFKHMISEPDKGQANALNKGFRLATGEIWGWLCADDELVPGALAHVAELFTQNPDITIVTGGCYRMFWDGTVIETTPSPGVMKRIAYQDGIEQPSTFWLASLHKAVGELDESYHFAFDWDWWNQLHQRGAKLKITPVMLSRYYFSETNKTSNGGTALVKELYRVIKRFGPLKGFLADIYMGLYYFFDLPGCYDQPPLCSKRRKKIHQQVLKQLVKWFGKEIIYGYNWNFASKQQRGLCWFK